MGLKQSTNNSTKSSLHHHFLIDQECEYLPHFYSSWVLAKIETINHTDETILIRLPSNEKISLPFVSAWIAPKGTHLKVDDKLIQETKEEEEEEVKQKSKEEEVRQKAKEEKVRQKTKEEKVKQKAKEEKVLNQETKEERFKKQNIVLLDNCAFQTHYFQFLFHKAAFEGNLEQLLNTTEFLLQPDSNGQTAGHWAVKGEQLEILKFLYSRYPSVLRCINNTQQTCYALAHTLYPPSHPIYLWLLQEEKSLCAQVLKNIPCKCDILLDNGIWTEGSIIKSTLSKNSNVQSHISYTLQWKFQQFTCCDTITTNVARFAPLGFMTGILEPNFKIYKREDVLSMNELILQNKPFECFLEREQKWFEIYDYRRIRCKDTGLISLLILSKVKESESCDSCSFEYGEQLMIIGDKIQNIAPIGSGHVRKRLEEEEKQRNQIAGDQLFKEIVYGKITSFQLIETYSKFILLHYRNQKQYNWTILHLGVSRNNWDICNALVTRVPDLLSIKDRLLRLPLHLAASIGSLRLCKLFVENNPFLVRDKDINGNTPCDIARNRCFFHLIQYFDDIQTGIEHYIRSLKRGNQVFVRNQGWQLATILSQRGIWMVELVDTKERILIDIEKDIEDLYPL